VTVGSASRPAASGESEAARARRAAWIAAALYLVVALWAVRVVLPQPATAVPYPAALHTTAKNMLTVSLNDQELIVATTTWNARNLARPWRLFDNGQCYPTPRPATLGEHMFGMGLLAALPYLLTRDPIVTYNTVIVLKLWIAGIAMYALVRYWTGSGWAALVAGLLFAFHPLRLGDTPHPYVTGNEWAAPALLFADRLFRFRRWRDAAGLAFFLALQVLESLYPLIALTLLGGVYGAYLVVRERRTLVALAPKLAGVAIAVALVAAAVFVPYLHTKEVWDVLGHRSAVLYNPIDFAPKGPAYPGTIALALIVVALLDRIRRRRDARGYDPRLVMLVAGIVVAAASVARIPVPFVGALPGPYVLAARTIPGLDAVRVPADIARGTLVVTAFLAGYGALVLLERAEDRRARAAIGFMLAGAALVEVFVPSAATASFGRTVTMLANPIRPPAELIELYRSDDGPVLDVPFTLDTVGMRKGMPHAVFLSAFHRRPVAACYNSYTTSAQSDLVLLAARLPDADATTEIAALGFRTLVAHEELLGSRGRAASLREQTWPQGGLPGTPLAHVGHAPEHTFYRFTDAGRVDASFVPLATGVVPGRASADPPLARVSFVFHNGSTSTYRHPDPIEPTLLVARWTDAGGRMADVQRVRTLLPLALVAGQSAVRTVLMPVPSVAGEYEVTLAPAAAQDLVIARTAVAVQATDAGGRAR
jgi:hypothetical protein